MGRFIGSPRSTERYAKLRYAPELSRQLASSDARPCPHPWHWTYLSVATFGGPNPRSRHTTPLRCFDTGMPRSVGLAQFALEENHQQLLF